MLSPTHQIAKPEVSLETAHTCSSFWLLENASRSCTIPQAATVWILGGGRAGWDRQSSPLATKAWNWILVWQSLAGDTEHVTSFLWCFHCLIYEISEINHIISKVSSSFPFWDPLI